jgi:hypothetical protein
MTVISGRISFEDNPFPEKSTGAKLDENDFIRLKEEGDYMVMLLSPSPFTYQEHWTVNARNEKRSVRCAVRNCTLCAEAALAISAGGDQAAKDASKQLAAKSKFAIEAYLLGKGQDVLGQTVGRPGILEFGPQVFGQIRTVSNMLKKVGGTLDRALLMINRDKRRGPTGMYTVAQIPMAYSLNKAQQDLLTKFQERGLDLAKLYETPTDEANMRRLGRIGGGEVAAARPGATIIGAAAQTGGTKFTDSW